MTPPELATDAPILDIFEPVAICVFIFSRVEFDVVVHHWSESDFGKMLHFEEPLHREFWFDRYISTLRTANFVSVVLNFFEETSSFEVDNNLFAHIETVHAYVHTCSFADSAIVVEDINALEIVFFAKHVVVYVVSRSYFEATSTKFNINIFVFNNRNFATYDRNDYAFAFEMSVFRVVRVDTHCSVAHNGFRTSSCYDGISVFANDFITEVVEFALLFFEDNLFVR